MNRFIHRFRLSKYKRITEGLIFALISATALLLCLNSINDPTESQINMALTFCVAMISMLMGLAALFHKEEVS